MATPLSTWTLAAGLVLAQRDGDSCMRTRAGRTSSRVSESFGVVAGRTPSRLNSPVPRGLRERRAGGRRVRSLGLGPATDEDRRLTVRPPPLSMSAPSSVPFARRAAVRSAAAKPTCALRAWVASAVRGVVPRRTTPLPSALISKSAERPEPRATSNLFARPVGVLGSRLAARRPAIQCPTARRPGRCRPSRR